MSGVWIAGGGPAGASAAIAARLEGCPVRLFDRQAAPRHKVCGEFLSPQVCEVLDALHAWEGFLALGPRRIQRCVLHLGGRAKRWNLCDCGWGLSRLRLDELLMRTAIDAGAAVARGEPFDATAPPAGDDPLILACGRKPPPSRGDRLFGFKAHFEGPCDDAVELFFGDFGYAGVSGIENNLTNVCCLAPESVLRKYDFQFDDLLGRPGPLAHRLRPLRRTMRWIAAGPLSFSMPPRDVPGASVYPAGDSLGFVDPYTGSGIWNALLTGRLAGIAAARRTPPADYLKRCASMLRRPFLMAAALRYVVAHKGLHGLFPLAPGRLLFDWTRADWRSA